LGFGYTIEGVGGVERFSVEKLVWVCGFKVDFCLEGTGAMLVLLYILPLGFIYSKQSSMLADVCFTLPADVWFLLQLPNIKHASAHGTRHQHIGADACFTWTDRCVPP